MSSPVVLVTGGLGMIGAHTAQALVEAGRSVVVTSHRTRTVPSFLAGRVQVEPVDLTDREALLALGTRYEISDIVHLAGTIPGDDPVSFFRHDSAALFNALDAARAWSVSRFAVASSLGVYAGRPEVPWTEDLALPTVELPHLILAFKKAVEPITTHALRDSGVVPVLLRIGSIWGPLFDPYSPFYGVVGMISSALRGESLPPLYEDDGGDGCYAPDAGQAVAALITAPTLNHHVYNVSRGVPYTHGEVAAAVSELRPDLRLDLRPGRSAGPGPDPYLDVSRLARDTGFAPRFDVPAAVAHYLAWRADNPR